MTDQVTPPVSPVQSTAAPQQNASYPVLETSSEAETPKNEQTAYSEHISSPSVIRELPTVRKLHPAQEKHLWTRDSARLAGLKSAEARRQRKLNPPSPPTSHPQPLEAVNPRLELIREQIELTRTVLNDDDAHFCPQCKRSGMEPHHRAALLRALDSLLDRERILLGIPGPGTLKPMSQSRRRVAPSDLAPLPILPTDGQ